MNGSNKSTVKKTICPLDCPDACGIIATLESGKICRLTGDPAHPFTQGFLCRKMRNYHERIYSKDRLLYPQKRIGKKGEGKFEQISWDETWELLADRLGSIIDEYGGEAILPFMYAGNMGAVARTAGHPFFHRIGASRLEQTICSTTARAGWQKQCGSRPGTPPEVAEDASLIVAWGINMKVTNVHFWQYVRKAQKKGAKLIVIDPYRNITGKSADIYLPVQPGGDTALALGAIKALLEHGVINLDNLNKQTKDFSHLNDYLQKTSWTFITEQCGLSKSTIEYFALLLKSTPQTFLRIGIGLTRNSRGAMAVRAIVSLAAVVGLFEGGPGRGVLLSSNAFTGPTDALTHPNLAALPSRIINMIQLGMALQTAKPKVRALMVFNANPLSVVPDTSTVRDALSKNSLFTVVHEQVMTPTARFADLLLPATTSFENRDLYTGYGHFHMSIVDPVIPPQGEAISNFDFFQTLAKKMHFDDSAFYESIDERLDNYTQDLEGLPADFSLKTYTPGSYICSNRCQGSSMKNEEHQPLFSFTAETNSENLDFPRLIAGGEAEDVDLVTRYPFHLITPPHMDLLNSTFGERYPEKKGEVLIHPEDADTYYVQDGDEVLLKNFRGETKRIARVSFDTQIGLLVAEGLFWENTENQNGINDLTSQKVADLGGGATFHESRVAILPLH